MTSDFEWLRSRHPIYIAWEDIWRRNERRMRGGDGVLKELRRFDWELDGGQHYLLRQQMATYVNYPDMFADTIVGHLIRKAPRVDEGSLNFGNLGKVRADSDRDPAAPNPAEMVYYNADGVGSDGSQWNNFWAQSTKWAMATGHRWILVEAPMVPAGKQITRADELKGKRPYLVSFSPLSVTNWHFEDGQLQFAIVVTMKRQPRVEGNKMLSNEATPEFMLMVRAGFAGFAGLGDTYTNGGWWKYDYEDVMIGNGTWDKTDGEIPFFPHFYQRDEGEVPSPLIAANNTSVVGAVQLQAISRPGVTELGNAAVGYMNLSSAADFDAWDAATSIQFLTGVDEKGFNLAVAKIAEGSRYAPLPASEENGGTPGVHDGSTGAVVSSVFQERLATKRSEAGDIAIREVATTSGFGDRSGIAQQADFANGKAPKLSLVASELEQAQNTAIHFLEMRWGKKPKGYVEWTKDFQLIEVLDSVNSIFALQKLAGVSSPTLISKGIVMAARSRDMINSDTEAAKIGAEIEKSVADAAAAATKTQLTPDNAQGNGTGHGVGGDGTGTVPGQTRFGSVGKPKNKP